MANVIRFKRGSDGSLPNPVGSGEPLWSENNYKLYVGVNSSSSKWVGAEIDNGTSLGTSQTKLATQYAIKSYVDTQLDTQDALSELGDTTIASIADANMLLYHNGDSKWKNMAISGDATITNAGALTLAGTIASVTSLANLTTVGTIATGTWQGTTIAVAHGGTGQTNLTNLITLGTHSSGNYVATIADSGTGGVAVVNSGAESAAITLELDVHGLTTDTIASGDFVAFSDEGTSGDPTDKITVDNLMETGLSLVTADTVAVAADHFVFLDGGASGSTNKASIASLMTATAGTGITSTNGVLSVDATQAITTVSGDFTVTGDLTVSGDTVTQNVSTLVVEDPMIKLASGNTGSDEIDFGFYGTYEDSAGTPEYSGIVRDASSGDGEWIFFDSLTTEPSTTTTVGLNNFAYASIKCADITGVDDDGSGNSELNGFNIDGGGY
tara:strand:- start:675 stop:1997 length:1323 start_codon:yes stop_codon:yes gene_type:complete